MDEPQELSFDFDFQGESRSAILEEARYTLRSMDQSLSRDVAFGLESIDPNQQAADDLLNDLQNHVAELGDSPQIYELKEDYFKNAGWNVPARFADLNQTHRFFWMQVPMVLSQKENMPFSKLELAIQFNPAETQGTRKPISVLVFPNKKLLQLAHFEQNASLVLNENFDLEIRTPPIDVQAAQGAVKAGAEVKIAGQGGFNFSLGPFTHDLTKLELEHTEPLNSKVFWKVFTAKYLQAERPDFVVVFQIPRQVTELKIAAAMQASHQFDMGAAGLGQTLKYLRENLVTFFKQGAPIQNKTVWDLSSLL